MFRQAGLSSLVARIGGGSLLTAGALAFAQAPSTNASPDFHEVFQLIQKHVPAITESELNRAAVQGLLQNLEPKVVFQPAPGVTEAAETNLLSRSAVFDEHVAYLRVAGVRRGLPEAVSKGWQESVRTNRLVGLVLDLRYADGEDYQAATATADLFLSEEKALLDAGSGVLSSTAKTNAITVPLVVLVNARTAAAAEALAAALRQRGAALLLGSRTAGRAVVYREFPLASGGQLRLMAAPVRLGDGSPVGPGGLDPDIGIEVAAADERAYFADPFRVLTNPAGSVVRGTVGRRVPLNEAELVRERRENINDGQPPPRARRVEQERPLVTDPALARAIDLLKVLAVLRKP